MQLSKVGLGVVLIAALICVSSVSASEIALEGIEARLGFISIGETDAGSTFGIGATADLGMLSETLGLEGGIDFWSKSYDVGLFEWSWTNISFNCNVRYDFGSNGDSSIFPYAFGGLGLNYQKASWDNPQGVGVLGSYDASNMEFGINAGAAVEFGKGDGMIPVARAGYSTNGGADYLFISGGIKFPMGK